MAQIIKIETLSWQSYLLQKQRQHEKKKEQERELLKKELRKS